MNLFLESSFAHVFLCSGFTSFKYSPWVRDVFIETVIYKNYSNSKMMELSLHLCSRDEEGEYR